MLVKKDTVLLNYVQTILWKLYYDVSSFLLWSAAHYCMKPFQISKFLTTGLFDSKYINYKICSLYFGLTNRSIHQLIVVRIDSLANVFKAPRRALKRPPGFKHSCLNSLFGYYSPLKMKFSSAKIRAPTTLISRYINLQVYPAD